MNKKPTGDDDDDMLPEYDLANMKGVRGKYFERITGRSLADALRDESQFKHKEHPEREKAENPSDAS